MTQSNKDYNVKTADRIAANVLGLWPQLTAGIDWSYVRDKCDFETQGDLDYVRLNILADMVMNRVEAGWKNDRR